MASRADIAWLRDQPAFASMSKREVDRLLSRTSTRTWQPGEAIVRRGDPGTSMFLIREGRVEVRVVGDTGRLRFTKHLEEGEIFGEMALFTGAPRSADVVVPDDASPCRCIVIEKATLEPELERHPTLASFLTEILGERLLEADAMRMVGKYHIVRPIGSGAMATVFEGYHADLNRGVAIKMLSHSLVYHTDIASRFRNEAQLLASLKHDGIVQVFDLERAYGTAFIVMEKLPGMDLERMLAQHGPMSPADVRVVCLRVAQALEYAHGRGVIHRDIKPSNIFRLPDGSLKLVDFGIATGAGATDEDGELLCSPAYVSPEVIDGADVDGRADLYSLGITAYKLLTGEAPFPRPTHDAVFEAHRVEPLPALDPSLAVPAELGEFLDRATRKNPADRFASAGEVVALLDRDGRLRARDQESVPMTLAYAPEDREQVQTIISGLRSSLAANPNVQLSVGDPERTRH